MSSQNRKKSITRGKFVKVKFPSKDVDLRRAVDFQFYSQYAYFIPQTDFISFQNVNSDVILFETRNKDRPLNAPYKTEFSSKSELVSKWSEYFPKGQPQPNCFINGFTENGERRFLTLTLYDPREEANSLLFQYLHNQVEGSGELKIWDGKEALQNVSVLIDSAYYYSFESTNPRKVFTFDNYFNETEGTTSIRTIYSGSSGNQIVDSALPNLEPYFKEYAQYLFNNSETLIGSERVSSKTVYQYFPYSEVDFLFQVEYSTGQETLATFYFVSVGQPNRNFSGFTLTFNPSQQSYSWQVGNYQNNPVLTTNLPSTSGYTQMNYSPSFLNQLTNLNLTLTQSGNTYSGSLRNLNFKISGQRLTITQNGSVVLDLDSSNAYLDQNNNIWGYDQDLTQLPIIKWNIHYIEPFTLNTVKPSY